LFNIIGKRYWFFLLSAIVIVPGALSLIIFGLNPSPDFVGGSEIEVQIHATGQTTQLANLLKSSTSTSALPAGHILSTTPGGTNMVVRANISTAETQISALVKKAVGVAPENVALTSKATCAPNCLYSFELTSTLGSGGAKVTKLSAALVKAYPANGKKLAGGLVSTANGSKVKVEVPVRAAETPLSNIFNGYVTLGVPPLSTTFAKSSTCPAQAPLLPSGNIRCTFTIITPTALTATQKHLFAAQFSRVFPKTSAKSGVSPQSVNTVGFSACKATCYDIRSSYLNGYQIAYFTARLQKAYPGNLTQIVSSTSVGSDVAASTKQNAIIAVAVAALFILGYITFAFRKMPHPARYGAAAIIAMLHDVLVVVGIFSILGKVLNMEVDATFVTALLTIIGFSVHDTIVIFDRIRENVSRRTGEAFEAVVNHSVLQSFVRSINTSFTVVLTLGAIFLFTGEQIRTFVLAMLIGIISGTYSSIFNASPILVVWQTGEWKRLFGRRGNVEDTTLTAGRARAATRPSTS
jgi:preprotein translocase SecF subunit